MTTAIQVITTTETKVQAQQLARALVQKRVAACVQIIGPITSVYWWQGKVEETTEYQCVIKSQSDRYPALEVAIKTAHPYAVPEILATPIVHGSADYLAWLDSELKPKP